MSHARQIFFCAAAAVLSLTFSPTAFSQQVIIHSSFLSDDGNPAKDDDGVVNGVVGFRGGAVHVVLYFSVSATTQFPNPVLIIRPGAIVKMADRYDSLGGTLHWAPTTNGYISAGTDNATIKIDGATITDIRDDSEGGDTNGDGNATVPSRAGWGYIRFSGSPRDRVSNSTIKYCTKIGHIGSMGITTNWFQFFGSCNGGDGFPGNTSPIVVNASPRISGNIFERSSLSSGVATLDLRGMSPIVESNTFRDSSSAPAVWIGPARQYLDGTSGNLGPTSGTIIVSNNRFESSEGISLSARGTDPETLYSKTQIRAVISHNTLRAPRNIGRALQLAFPSDASVSGNDISNYSIPLLFYFDPQSQAGNRTRCGLEINNNHFSLQGISSSFAIGWSPPPTSPAAQSHVLINMKNNFWGDPTGPLDTTASDGRQNPRGRGLKVITNSIDYVPFIGAALPPVPDAIHLTVNSPDPTTPLEANATVTLNTFIDSYNLGSTPTGKIVVLLRDADGIILNQPGTIVNVTSGNHMATIPPIQFTVPSLSNVVAVEANLAPEGNVQATRSNQITYNVARPPSSLNITRFNSTGESRYKPLVRGDRDTLLIGLTYTLSTSAPNINGSLKIEVKERIRETGIERGLTYQSLNLVAPPGVNRTMNTTYEVFLEMRDVISDPRFSEIFVRASLANDSNRVVGEDSRTMSIYELANGLNLLSITPLDTLLRPIGRYHFLVGENPAYELTGTYAILTTGITNWELWPGYDEILDASDVVLARFLPSAPDPTPVSTGYHNMVLKRKISSPIPANGRTFRSSVRIFGPSGIVVAVDTIKMRIAAAAQLQARAVPSGPSQVSLSPITASLAFSANQFSSSAFAEEYNSPFNSTGPLTGHGVLENFYWRFIPLLRYWSVYDTLRDGTFNASVTFAYTPADFPSDPNFREDSLVVAGYNPLSRQLEVLPSTLNRTARTITTPYTKFFDTWVVASKATILVNVPPATGNPAVFSLDQNYPNPFNPTTTIRYSMASEAFVSLKLFDILGREIQTLVNEVQSAGLKSVRVDAGNLATGVYFYRLSSRTMNSQKNEFVETKKLLLLR